MKQIVCFSSFLILITGVFVSCGKEEFGGLGIQVPTQPQKVSKTNPYIIATVFKGGSGEAAGLKTGDTIISIDGRPVDGLMEDYIVKNLLRGKVGSLVVLEIERSAENEKKLMVFRVRRGQIVVQE